MQDSAIRMELVSRLTRDIRNQTTTLSQMEIRYVVSTYYRMQDDRIRMAHQARDLGKALSENALVSYLEEQFAVLEKAVGGCLRAYAESHPVGRWALAQKGIGPIITAGLLSHIDIEKAPTVGHIWAFAGLDPTVKWERGQKRPWNADLKVICWKIGESFVKVSGLEDAYYGKVYKARKAFETANNEALKYKEQAENTLENKTFRDDTVALSYYTKGMLPPARIHLRACRYTTKLFLSHMHKVWYEEHFGVEAPNPYPIAHLQHVDFLPPPGYTPPAALVPRGLASWNTQVAAPPV